MPESRKIRERKKMIIGMLREAYGPVHSRSIIEEVSKKEGKTVGKSVITDNINSLRNDGFEIVSYNDGYILKESENVIGDDDACLEAYDEVTEDTVTEWLVLLVLEKEHDRYMPVEEIHTKYQEIAGNISNTRLRTHLSRLEQLGYISRYSVEEMRLKVFPDSNTDEKASNKLFFHVNEGAPAPVFIDLDDLLDFNNYYIDRGYATELRETLEDIRKKIALVSSDINEEESGAFRSFGRINDIPQEQMEKLDIILSLPFREHALYIRYKEKDEEKDCLFKTALLVFSVETNGFYLIGEAKKGGKKRKKWKPIVFRTESVLRAAYDKDTKNDIYESVRYKTIFRKMWSVVIDDPVHVEVWFEDVPYVRRQIEALARVRKDTAKVSFPLNKVDGQWIKYSDEMVGVNAFMRFVRGLGSSALIIRPEADREHMIKKTEELLEKYEELHKEWEDTQTHFTGSQD